MTRGGKPASASLGAASVPATGQEGTCGTLGSPGAESAALAARKELASAHCMIHEFVVDPDRKKLDCFIVVGVNLLARYRLRARRLDPTDRAFGTTDNRVWTVEGTVGSFTLRFEDGTALWCPSYGWSLWGVDALQAAHPEWFAQFPEARMPEEGDISDEELPARKARKKKAPAAQIPARRATVTATALQASSAAVGASRAAGDVQGTLALF